MTDKELLKIVTGFRKGILGRRKPLMKCYMICAPLVTYLNLCEIKCTLCEGEIVLGGHNKGLKIGHYWITLADKRIIDPTASQFNNMGRDDMPIVYLGIKPKHYKIKK